MYWTTLLQPNPGNVKPGIPNRPAFNFIMEVQSDSHLDVQLIRLCCSQNICLHKYCVFTGLMLVVVSCGLSSSSFAVLNGTANVAVR